jgi:hypothetical protein
VGVRNFDRKKECMNKIKARIRARQLQSRNSEKVPSRAQTAQLKKTEPQIGLSLKMKLSILDTLDEAKRLGNFVRIYPSEGCQVYDRFFLTPRASNKAVYGFLYLDEYKEEAPRPLPPATEPEEKKDLGKQKIIITGDDILIEYLSRVLHAARSITTERLKPEWRVSLDKFVNHSIWQSICPALPHTMGLLQRLEARVVEMKERRKQSESALKDPVTYMNQKNQVVRGFSAQQLENMLKSSSKSVAKDIMSSLFIEGNGILTEMIKQLAKTSVKRPKQLSVTRNSSLKSEEFEKFSPKRSYFPFSLEKCVRSSSFVNKSLPGGLK